MQILNLTQHIATPEQVLAGVVEPIDKKEVQELLTFIFPPTLKQMEFRATRLAQIALENNCNITMLGGAPYFMGSIELALVAEKIMYMYSFSERVSVETTDEDGSIVKTNVFKHTGWVY